MPPPRQASPYLPAHGQAHVSSPIFFVRTECKGPFSCVAVRFVVVVAVIVVAVVAFVLLLLLLLLRCLGRVVDALRMDRVVDALRRGGEKEEEEKEKRKRGGGMEGEREEVREGGKGDGSGLRPRLALFGSSH